MWQVIGQTRAVSLLQRSLEVDSLAHAYLFVGPAHVGKMTLALNLAQALNCEAVEPPCGQCLSDQIRQLQHSANLPPFEGRCKVFIIDGVEMLSTEAANCLLKTLEEPVDKVVFILLTTNERLLPATVISRCQRVELLPLAATEVETALEKNWGVEPQKAELLATLSRGCLGWAVSIAFDDGLLRQRAERLDKLLDIVAGDYEERFAYAARLATQFGQNRGEVQAILDLWRDWWRDLLLVMVGRSDTVTNIDRLATLSEMAKDYNLAQVRAFINNIRAAGDQLKQNANPRLVLEVLMISLPEVEWQGGRSPAAQVEV
jgi:DNA polymerase-3 subunit delta'